MPAGSSGPADAVQVGFGVLLRAFRERGLWSQEQLAARSGVSVRTIGNLEQGKVGSPRGASVRLLADALDLTGPERQQFQGAARRLTMTSTTTAPSSASSGLAPCQLPPDVADFTGRAEQIRLVRQLFAGTTVGWVPMVAVAGKAGVGKTALAIHVAHQLRERFPDGQLFVNLQGAHAHPLEPDEILARFLRALGVDGAAIPDTPEERAALYRALLADRKVLVVLDDTAHEGQVRLLLPGSPSCGVLATSRARLAGLEGARLLELDVLEPELAVRLLGAVAGAGRVATEPDSASAIVGYCGHLPLAVRIAGARLAARPSWSLARLADRLADERRRLNELVAGDLAVRASIALSEQSLGEDDRRTLRRLGLLEASDFPAWAASAVVDACPDAAEGLVEGLVDAQLLEVAGVDGVGQVRYRFHDLVRAYARERAEAEDTPEQRQASLARVLGGWLALVEVAAERAPDRTLGVAHGDAERWRPDTAVLAAVVKDPLGWFENERPALVTAVDQAAATGLDELAWDLAGCLARFFTAVNNHEDWRRTHTTGLAAARRCGNRRGQASILRALGELNTAQDRLGEALACLQEALLLSRDVDDRRGEAGALEGIAIVCQLGGETDRAFACVSEARTISTQLGDSYGEAKALYLCGGIYLDQGHPDAWPCLEQALAVFTDVGDLHTAALTLRKLGELNQAHGRLDRAAAEYGRCLALQRQLGNAIGVALARRSLGEVQLRRGFTQEGRQLLDEALSTFQELEYRYGQALTLRTLGELHAEDNDPRAAIAYLETAVDIWRDLGRQLWEARTLRSLGRAYALANRHDAAERTWTEASSIFSRLSAPEAEDRPAFR